MGAALIPFTMSSTETFCSSLANRDGQKASTSTLAAFTRAEILSSCNHTHRKKTRHESKSIPPRHINVRIAAGMVHSHRSASGSALAEQLEVLKSHCSSNATSHSSAKLPSRRNTSTPGHQCIRHGLQQAHASTQHTVMLMLSS